MRSPAPETPDAGITMLAELLPSTVASAELFADVDEAPMAGAESAAIARALPQRRQEFVAGRMCARRALADLGLVPGPIPRSRSGEPLWPDGVVGSITHCQGYRAAAVAPTSRLRAIGVDAEPHAPLPDGVLGLIANPREVSAIDRLRTAHRRIHWDRLIFSAKEATYKAHFPLHRVALAFPDVQVTMDPPSTTFVARVSESTAFRGRWLVRDGLVLTAVTVET